MSLERKSTVKKAPQQYIDLSSSAKRENNFTKMSSLSMTSEVKGSQSAIKMKHHATPVG